MKIRDRIIQYIKLLEFTVALFKQKNDYQSRLSTIPFGTELREKYLRNIKEIDKVIGINLSKLEELKKNHTL